MITINDITTWNWVKGSNNDFSFSVAKITEVIMPDEEVINLENYISEKRFFADMFNTEYMGFLTGVVSCSKEKLVQFINEFLNDNTDAKN